MKQEIQSLASKLSSEFERRSFIHENRHEFPGRQLFDMEPSCESEARVIQVDEKSKYEQSISIALLTLPRHILVQLRKLLLHHVSTIETELKNKEEQLESLQNLRDHYAKAGDVFDKGQANVSRSQRLEV